MKRSIIRLIIEDILYIVTSEALGKRFCNLPRSPIVLLLAEIIFRWPSNFNWVSSIIPKCF